MREQTYVTIDIIVPRHLESSRGDAKASQDPFHLDVLLIKRGKEPYLAFWALPGGHIESIDKTLTGAATRELYEETGLWVDPKSLTLVGVYGDRWRDPRGRYVSVAYHTETMYSTPIITAGDDAAEFQWFPIDALPAMAFDHAQVIKDTFGL